NEIRSKVLSFFFKLDSIKTHKIDKEKKEKKQLINRNKKVLKQLKHTTQRYVETFLKADIKIELNNTNSQNKFEINPEIEHLFQNSSKKIGIAPFAMHLQKQYPIEKMTEVIYLLEKKGYEIFIFGGGNNEKRTAEKIGKKSNNVHSLIGKFSLEDEIVIISKLNLMLTMDSANMHIAALTGIKIISVWGATHPFAGFTPFVPVEKSYIIQNETLSCRPCSVYGNKKCFKETLECLNSILPEEIVQICESALK
ncbi:MAG: glycosyltransferase family 9 protein, partial [Bacteroidales bacterium]|nr:glycosyltransferase family 9 protein [Bacteroidales bacterium]